MSAQSLKPGWKMVKFGDIAPNVAVRVTLSMSSLMIFPQEHPRQRMQSGWLEHYVFWPD